jgi:hypothetical protein
MVSVMEDTSGIARFFFPVALVCQVVTCAFDTSQSEVAIISGVPISLIVCTLNNIPFAFGRFKFYFALLYQSTLNMSLLHGAGFSSAKNIERGR